MFAYSYSLNEHAQLYSEACSSFKVYLHISPYFVFADSGGCVKFGRCVCLFKHFLGVHVKKAYCKFSTYFWAFSKGPGQHVAHMRSLARAFAQRVKVSIANTLKRVWNCLNVWCVSANSERSAKAAQMFALIWNYRPWAMSFFVR